jgi:hypothetical protein
MIIPPRFNGPPESAHGGYSAGMLARYLGSPTGAVVTLRKPPPLGTPLEIRAVNGGISVHDGDRLVAEAAPAPPLPDAVPPVSWQEAMAVSASYPGFESHPFPTCFACGPQRPPGDGLRLFSGPLPDGRCAAPWVVPEDIEPTLVWAALDCPGGWSIGLQHRPYVLGRLAGRVDALPAAGDGCVVMGATVSRSGRKAEALSTVYGPDGSVLARARATWIALSRDLGHFVSPGQH